MATITHDEPLIQLPQDAAELARCLADPEWRLFSGALYKIMIKGDDKIGADGSIEEGDSFVLPFKPNRAQKRFIRRLWHRNLILKAREEAEHATQTIEQLAFRNERNSRLIAKS